MIGIALALSAALLAASMPAPFERNGKWGYRDSRGRELIAPHYDMAQEFSPQGIAAVVDAQGWAYIDTGGRVVVRPLAVDNGPDYFAEGLARFRDHGKVGFFDRHGNVVIPAQYDSAMPFSEGAAAVCQGCREAEEGEHRAVKDGKWGFVGPGGALLIPLRYDEAQPFENGRARVRIGGKWTRVDRSGRIVP